LSKPEKRRHRVVAEQRAEQDEHLEAVFGAVRVGEHGAAVAEEEATD